MNQGKHTPAPVGGKPSLSAVAGEVQLDRLSAVAGEVQLDQLSAVAREVQLDLSTLSIPATLGRSRGGHVTCTPDWPSVDSDYSSRQTRSLP